MYLKNFLRNEIRLYKHKWQMFFLTGEKTNEENIQE